MKLKNYSKKINKYLKKHSNEFNKVFIGNKGTGMTIDVNNSINELSEEYGVNK